MKKSNLLLNLSVLITTGAFVKILGMLNKIIITRVLGVQGVSLYAIMMPTVMLLLGICSFSLSSSIQNIVSSNINKQNYSNRDLIIKSFIISTLLCIIVSLITLIFNYAICHYLLKTDEVQNAFMYFIPMYFFASYGGVLKGYYHGHNKLKIYAFAQAFEQVIRIILSLLIFIFANDLSLENCLILVVLSMGIGEFFQFLFLVIYSLFFTKLNNKTDITYKYSDFMVTSFTLTLNRLISSIGNFLEPIIFTYAFTLTGMSSSIATTQFGILHGYVIPLIITGSFISGSLQQAFLPSLTISKNNNKEFNLLLSKSFFLSFIPAILLFYLLLFYSKELLQLVYSNSIGKEYLSLMSLTAFISYFDGIFSSLLIIYKKENKMLIFNIFTSFIKLLLIFTFVQIPLLNGFGLPLSYSIVSIISCIYGIKQLYKLTTYRFSIRSILLSLFSFIYFICIGYIFSLQSNIILNISFTSLIYLLLALNVYRLYFKNSEVHQ